MISILCSNYNSDQYIDNYLHYLNNQLLLEFEVIFVDAKSTDSSLTKIKEFKFRDGIKTKIIECPQRIPIYAAWNMGIEQSSYDYVMNYNTDDKLFKSSLLTLSTYLRTCSHADIIYSDVFLSEDPHHGSTTGWYKWQDANIKENLLAGCCVGPFPLLKKKSVIDAGMFDPSFSISGDYEMWCRMQSKGYKFLKIEEPLGVYYNNPRGISTAQNLERITEHFRQDGLIRSTYA
jgi:glycosyltransferase involved in cell wall biosynthesis